ncbi:MAG TPA: XRE family transcriptional regulator [Kribbellaceae bacterium]|nr:XRE family transcriptional regulator [Kribbellaceae bacterium]
MTDSVGRAGTLTPSRLALARKRRGLTLVQLAAMVGLSVRSLSGYENGRQAPGPNALQRLAETLDVPVGFLTAGDLDEIPVDAISFRALSKLTAGQRDTARGAARIALLLAEWIERRFHLPDPDVPSLPMLDPETAAEVVRARWGLGVAPAGNLVRLLEAHGIRVVSLAADCAAVDAFSFVWQQTPYVLLNTTKSGERGRFDAAHELGHLVLHSEHRLPQGPDAEQDANRFAAAFLMPRASVLAHSLVSATNDRILATKHIWGVSAMALTHRLHELGLLTDWGYRTACVDLARRGYRTGEPGGIPRETSPLLEAVFRTLRAEGTSPVHIARDLHITTAELNRHVFGLVPTAVNGAPASTAPRRPAQLTVIKGSRSTRHRSGN